VLVELVNIYNGHNNGFIALSCRDAATRIGTSKDTASKAFSELVQKGFIEVARRGHFDRKSPHARSTGSPCTHATARANEP